jgi:Zn-dependent protease with chaperone function
MSEIAATRKGGIPTWGVATIILAVAAWLVAAWFLWQTRVPDGLDAPNLSPSAFFDERVLDETADYERFVRIVVVLSILASLAALVVLVRKIPALARSTGLGPIGSGMVVGMVMLVVLWAVDLPFSMALRWWDIDHDLAHGSWIAWLVEPWAVLGGSIGFIMLQIAVVMGFARKYPRFWWIPVPPIFLGITVLFVFVSPYLLAFGVDRPEDPQLRREARVLAERVGAEGTPVDVEKVSDLTTQPNAFAAGLGPTQRIVLFDTLLDGRFEDDEIEVVVAHEFAHIARRHILKGLGWSVLLAFPISFLVAEITRRRGGLGDPAVLPYGALVLVVINLAVAPAVNEISRRYEAEADWVALEATRDVDGAQGLFEGFATESLGQPEPPRWWHVIFSTHPTLMERIEMAEAFEARER